MEIPDNPSFLDIQPPNVIDTKKLGDIRLSTAMGMAGNDREEDVARRCRALTRLYAGGKSSKFAHDFKMGVTQWNNIEKTGKLSKDAAFKIVRLKSAVSLDWLWLGSERGLTPSQADEFATAYRDALTPTKPAKKAAKAPRTKKRIAG